MKNFLKFCWFLSLIFWLFFLFNSLNIFLKIFNFLPNETFVIKSSFNIYIFVLLFLIGICSFFIWFIILFKSYFLKNSIKKLKKDWTVIKARVIKIWKTSMSLNLFKPNKVVLEYTNSNNKKHIFESENINRKYNVMELIEVWDFIDVYVDEKNYKNYFVDIVSFIINK